MAAPKGHKARDWGAFGTAIMLKMRKYGSNYGGSQTPPKRKRRTVPHQKGVAFPGMWTPRKQGGK